MGKNELTIGLFFITIPLIIQYGSNNKVTSALMVIGAVGVVWRVFANYNSQESQKVKRSWVKTENFSSLEARVIKELPSYASVIKQIIFSLKQYSHKNLFKNYLGFNIVLGEEGQGKKEVIFELVKHCKSDVDLKAFYGGLYNENNVKNFLEELHHFIVASDDPVVALIDLDKFPPMALEILTDA
ncbi:MAG: hypothetical protein KC478_17085, partial [Bacteriovoracaceae bacterium]|nr:hypothetical protein [Bacteriovoracaceae bacterium]